MDSPAIVSAAPSRPLPLGQLPVFPAVALELISLLDQPEISFREIADLLRREPTLAADVLRVSNSALYAHHKEEILDLDTALVVIGLQQARRVSLNAAVRGLIGGALGLPELRRCWSHCVAAALVAESLCEEYGELGGKAYTAGLLHDLGMLALLALYPEEYRQMILIIERDQQDWRSAERSVFGSDHEQVGNDLVDRMGLPETLRPILSEHHEADTTGTGLLPLVAAADQIADLVGFSAGGRAHHSTLEEYLPRLRLRHPERATEKFERLRHNIVETVS